MGVFNPVARTAASIISGNRAPSDMLAVDVITQVDEVINWQDPNATPYQSLISRKGSDVVENATFYYLERPMEPREATLSADALVDATSLVVGSGEGSRFVAGDTVMFDDGEVVSITAVSTDTLTVERKIGGAVAPARSAGDRVYLLGPTAIPGGTIGTIKSVANTSVVNQCEYTRLPMGWEGRTIVTALHGGNDREIESKTKAIEFRKTREAKLIFGKYGTSAAGRPFADGLLARIGEGNTWNLNHQPMTERAFLDALGEGMRWGKGGYRNSGKRNKTLFCSMPFLSEINWFAHDRIQTKSMESVYGLSIMTLKTQYGTVNLVHMPLLDEVNPNLSFLVDLNHVKLVHLKDRGPRLYKNQQQPSADAEQWDWRTDEASKVWLPEAHMIFKNFLQE